MGSDTRVFIKGPRPVVVVSRGSWNCSRESWLTQSWVVDGNSRGRHSGQETIFEGFPLVLNFWWKISENGDRGSTQNFAARLMSIVVCPGEQFLEKLFRIRNYTLFENGYVPKFQKFQFSKFPGSQVLRMDCFPVYVHSQVLRMDCFTVYVHSQVLRMDCFPVYVHSQVLRMDCFPIFFNCWLIPA